MSKQRQSKGKGKGKGKAGQGKVRDMQICARISSHFISFHFISPSLAFLPFRSSREDEDTDTQHK
jgi:hypothetical protein